VEAFSIDYRGWKVYGSPNARGCKRWSCDLHGQIAEITGREPLSAADCIGAMMRLSWRIRDVHAYVSDPNNLFTAGGAVFLSKDYAKKRAALIYPNKSKLQVTAGIRGEQPDSSHGIRYGRHIASWIQERIQLFSGPE